MLIIKIWWIILILLYQSKVDQKKTKSLHFSWYRNREDLKFYESDVHDLAYNIATGKHEFEREISNLGWHLIFTTPEYVLKVDLDYYTAGKTGSASIQFK